MSDGSIRAEWNDDGHYRRTTDPEYRVEMVTPKLNRSKQASEKLVKLGYTNIIEIGGINSWPGETVNGDK